jgi:[ribosomal protein S5]-alanine N-acetyltransferase
MLNSNHSMHFPLSGEFVSLHPFVEANITSEYIGWLNDPTVVRYSNQRFSQHNQETCRAYLRSFGSSNHIFLSIQKDSKFIGTMTVYISVAHKTADMGIMIGDRQYWGKGFGQDAWITLMQSLFDRFHMRKVTGGALRGNTSMVNIMIKSGMQADGVRIGQELVDGNPVDILHFAKFQS